MITPNQSVKTLFVSKDELLNHILFAPCVIFQTCVTLSNLHRFVLRVQNRAVHLDFSHYYYHLNDVSLIEDCPTTESCAIRVHSKPHALFGSGTTDRWDNGHTHVFFGVTCKLAIMVAKMLILGLNRYFCLYELPVHVCVSFLPSWRHSIGGPLHT